MLAVAAALINPVAGAVAVDGQTTAGMGRADLTGLRRRKVGIVFRQPSLLPSLRAAEQLQVMARIDGRFPAGARGRAMDLLDASGPGRPGRLAAPPALRRPAPPSWSPTTAPT
ncbi:putative ABC transport system ATP-binding protein [Streptomyces radiopugnans]|uniref:Putative ABC transport system ATP-binding protein n=1 Tax=Streptomyces radiopugnans TaxID=403935 RepID=A0A1H9KA57_9ACTN|nr:putative ABC transport system ATP-binding protein [Streptomyces radiopugnans]